MSVVVLLFSLCVVDVLPVGAVDEVLVVDVVPEVDGGVVDVPLVLLVDDVPDAGLVVIVSVGTGTMVAVVSVVAVAAVDVSDDVVALVSLLVVVSVLLQAHNMTAANAAALIHFMKSSCHSHELPFIRATIFATSM